MSFPAQKVRRNTSPQSNRQTGPVKATLPFTYPAVTIACFSTSDTQRVNSVKGTKKPSPERFLTSSPSSRDRVSDRHNLTSPTPTVVSSLSRRSESTETIVSSCSSSYLRGEWPKSDPLITQAYFCPSNLTADKASQTPEEWCHSQLTDKKAGTRRSSSVGNSGESLKDIKARLAKTSKEATSNTPGSSRGGQKRTSPVCVIHHDFSVPGKHIFVPTISLPRPASQSSLDGVNQEIERLVLNSSSSLERLVKSPSDGRRAPVAREFKQRSSVLTQTPPISSTSDIGESPSVLMSADNADGFIEFGSKEDINASPELTSFVLERLPPDGCEKIFVKFSEKKSRESVFSSTAPVSTLNLVPSEKSAFNVPLDRRAVSIAYPGPILSGYMKSSGMHQSIDY